MQANSNLYNPYPNSSFANNSNRRKMQQYSREIVENAFDNETNQYEYDMPNDSDEKQKSCKEKLVRVAIYDRGIQSNTINTKHKKEALVKALFEMMYRELLSDADIKPRFHSYDFVHDVYKAVAVGESSAEFLKDRVERMQPPWRGACLEVVFASSKQTNVEVYVPGKHIFKHELLSVIKTFDGMIQTSKWKQLKFRPHSQGHVYTFQIDSVSFDWLEKYNGVIPYMDTVMEFRVLNDEFL